MVSFIKTAALAIAISAVLTAIYALIYWAAVRALTPTKMKKRPAGGASVT